MINEQISSSSESNCKQYEYKWLHRIKFITPIPEYSSGCTWGRSAINKISIIHETHSETE